MIWVTRSEARCAAHQGPADYATVADHVLGPPCGSTSGPSGWTPGLLSVQPSRGRRCTSGQLLARDAVRPVPPGLPVSMSGCAVSQNTWDHNPTSATTGTVTTPALMRRHCLIGTPLVGASRDSPVTATAFYHALWLTGGIVVSLGPAQIAESGRRNIEPPCSPGCLYVRLRRGGHDCEVTCGQRASKLPGVVI
jgi:hypothetical protein